MVSCKKEIKTEPQTSPESKLESGNNPSGDGSSFACADVLEPDWYTDSVSTQTVLGYQLQGNPYSVAVMRQAHTNLYGNNGNLTSNRKYVRFRPANDEQAGILQELEPELDLYDYPLDREVTEEGDYYLQPGLSLNDFPWLYTVVDIGYTPPAGIQYEIIAEIYVPDTDLALENEALRITGNPINEGCNIGENLIPVPCEECGGGGGGGSTPDTRKPSGQIRVWDSNRNFEVPLRRTRIVARRWLKIEKMYTDDNGNF